jgi:threonine aldolase
LISFYDTSTLPTQEMLDAIASAPLGDDVYGQDPTVNELEAVAAGLMGKEAAVLMPSGTMANLAAVLSWTRPSDEVVLEAEAHLLYYEAGGISGVAGCVPLGVPGERGVLRAEEVQRHLRQPDLHYPVTRLLCVENTHNRAGGTITPPAVMKELRELCDAHQLALHVDGARIFNAAVALDIPAADLVADADSVFFALSKGLSAPVGAVLAGSADFVGRARRDAAGRDRRRGRAGRAAHRDRPAPRGPRAGPEPGRQAGRAARTDGGPG